MTTVKRLVSALAITFFALSINASAQAPSIEVTTDEDSAQFSTRGRAQSVRVEVFAPSGELVFEGDGSDGQAVAWRMRDQQGERVADGVYLATVTVTDSLGKRRKRIEQVTVGGQSQDAAAVANAPAPQDSLAPTGAGTAGRIAKWTTSTNLGNSVVTESAGKVGVNITPTATLQANGLQPPALATTGTPAPILLQTTGGKGGNTTVGGGKVAGAGAGISLVGGNGGDAPAGSKRGAGGNITLQPGSTGAGAGTPGASGNVLMAPTGVGNVGIGTPTPASRLSVNGSVQLLGAGSGIKFPDNSVQTKAGLSAVQHDQTLAGGGTAASPLRVGVPLNLSGTVLDAGVISAVNTGDGFGVVGQSVKDAAGVYGYNTGTGIGVAGQSSGSNGVYGQSASSDGVHGTSATGTGVSGNSNSGYGVYGYSVTNEAGHFQGNVGITKNLSFGTTTRQMINLYGTTYGIGVQYGTQYFRSDLHFGWYRDGAHSDAELNPGGGVRLMYLDGSGRLTVLANVCAANIPCSSDARLKRGVTNLNYGLNQLLRLRPVSWHWKSEPEGTLQLGLVAQEVEGVMPELVTREADATKPLGLNYMALLPVAVKAIQEQQAQIQQQQKLIGQQARRNEEQTLQIEQLQAQLEQVRRAVRRRAARR